MPLCILAQLLFGRAASLSASVGDSLSTVARARTLTVLTRLEGDRKGSVVRFLYESGLLAKDRLIVNVNGSDLREAALRSADLGETDLGETDLRRADLRGASLRRANLRRTDLRQAWLFEADLAMADLTLADLDRANLSEASLRGANLFRSDLGGATLSGANLRGANLHRANLEGAIGITNKQLEKAKSLKGATMPNGQKYEDWLKSKET